MPSAHYGFNAEVGTWFITMKVDNDEVWHKVKNGEIKGFSIEGYFTENLEMTKNFSLDPGEKNADQIIEELKTYIVEYENQKKKIKKEK